MATQLLPNLIPDFIASSDPKGLRRLMLRNNAMNGMMFKYFDIQYVEKEDLWYAWFYRTPANAQALIDEMIEETKDNKSKGGGK